jgi:signal transduction histidine kinase
MAAVQLSRALQVEQALVRLMQGEGGTALTLGTYGAALGMAQWLYLRRWAAQAGWWVLASAGGMAFFGWLVGQAMESIFELVFVGAVPAVFTGLVLAWLLIVALTNPLLHLGRLARKVASGDLSVRSPVWADDEFGYLARSFNSMVDALAESQAALVKSNDDLSASNTELRRLWEDLKQKEEMRASLLARAVSAQEEERLRLSRELHDGTGQMLATALVHLKVLERAEEVESARAGMARARIRAHDGHHGGARGGGGQRPDTPADGDRDLPHRSRDAGQRLQALLRAPCRAASVSAG